MSSTQAGHGAIRIMPACMAMGQAAGAAAALSLDQGVNVRDVSVPTLLETHSFARSTGVAMAVRLRHQHIEPNDETKSRPPSKAAGSRLAR